MNAQMSEKWRILICRFREHVHGQRKRGDVAGEKEEGAYRGVRDW